jgi:hypothetical protein
MVRDQALLVSGLLTNQLHGPPVFPPLPADVWKPFQGGDKWQTPDEGHPDRYRRSIYTYTKRSIPYPMFASFDAPSREFCTARRLRSNTPLQALMTLNDETFREASQAFARRMLASAGAPREQIAFGWRLATCREADAGELQALTQLYLDSDPASVGRGPPDQASAGRGSPDPAPPPDEDALAAMANVASVLLNLDEVLCK